MNNTALRAGAQSANNTHMVFANEEHEEFYHEKMDFEEIEKIFAEMGKMKRAENSVDGNKK